MDIFQLNAAKSRDYFCNNWVNIPKRRYNFTVGMISITTPTVFPLYLSIYIHLDPNRTAATDQPVELDPPPGGRSSGDDESKHLFKRDFKEMDSPAHHVT